MWYKGAHYNEPCNEGTKLAANLRHAENANELMKASGLPWYAAIKDVNQYFNYLLAWKVINVLLLQPPFHSSLEILQQAASACLLLYLFDCWPKPASHSHCLGTLLQMLFSKVSHNFIFQMVVGLPVPPKPCFMAADRGTSTLNFEMIEHLFYLQGNETLTLRRKWSEKNKCRNKDRLQMLFDSGESYRLQTGDICSLMEIGMAWLKWISWVCSGLWRDESLAQFSTELFFFLNFTILMFSLLL